MSLSYKPSNGATFDQFWAPVFLSYRDITGQAPIDQVAYPGVNVKAACSPDNVFDSDSYQTCISNLLAADFRRLIFDLYWDTLNRRFNLCPVEIPQQSDNATAQAVSVSAAVVTGLARRRLPGTLWERQGTANDTALTSSSVASATSTTTRPSPTSVTAPSGNTLYQLGQYQCSNDLTLQDVLSLLHSYIGSTSDPVLARLAIIELNLHAAASINDPDASPATPSAQGMPSGAELIGNQFGNENLERDLYKPSDLLRERSNLNASWYAVGSEGQLPFTKYFTTTTNAKGFLSTTDGWPNEGYLLFTQLTRFIATWGIVDEQMQGYEFQNDSNVIFPRGYMKRNRAFQEDGLGSLTSGCFYNEQNTSVARANDSWAVGVIGSTTNAEQGSFISNLTACGIAPILNTSMANLSASNNHTIYQHFTEASVFGWASGEPRNTSSPGADIDGSGDRYRCVVLDSSDAYRGHWHIEDCQRKRRVACRVDHQPYDWVLTEDEHAYGDGPNACRKSTAFSLPRTGLENTYLYQRVLSDAANRQDSDFLTGVWINLNSLDVQNCWVTSGPNGTCVYSRDQNNVRNREILIPTIAALIVLILTVLTVLVKCTNNINHNRRSKTGPGGWEYEGVPS